MATRQPARQSAPAPAREPARRKTTTRKTAQTAGKTPRRQPAAGMKEISPEEIRKRAYELFRARGARHGRDLDDWLQAEQELRGTRKK